MLGQVFDEQDYFLLKQMMMIYQLQPVEYLGAWFLTEARFLLEFDVDQPGSSLLERLRLSEPETAIPLYDCELVFGCPRPSRWVLASNILTEDEFLFLTSGQVKDRPIKSVNKKSLVKASTKSAEKDNPPVKTRDKPEKST